MIVCPIDRTPCDPACPDRFTNLPEGGCLITTLTTLGVPVLVYDENGGVTLCDPL